MGTPPRLGHPHNPRGRGTRCSGWSVPRNAPAEAQIASVSSADRGGADPALGEHSDGVGSPGPQGLGVPVFSRLVELAGQVVSDPLGSQVALVAGVEAYVV